MLLARERPARVEAGAATREVAAGEAVDTSGLTAAMKEPRADLCELLLTGLAGGEDGRYALAVGFDVHPRAIADRAEDWIASLARICSDPELARRACSFGWIVNPLPPLDDGSRRRRAALAADALRALPESYAFLASAICERVRPSRTDLGLQCLLERGSSLTPSAIEAIIVSAPEDAQDPHRGLAAARDRGLEGPAGREAVLRAVDTGARGLRCLAPRKSPDARSRARGARPR